MTRFPACLPRRPLPAALLSLACLSPMAVQAATVSHEFNIQAHLRPGEVFREQWAWRDSAAASSRGCFDSPAPLAGRTNFFTPPSSGAKSLQAHCGGAHAEASSTFEAQVSGFNRHTVTANASVTPPGPEAASANAQSVLGFQVGTQSRRGTVQWIPGWRIDPLSTHAVRSVGHDPIDLDFLDLDTGLTQSSRLWDSQVSLGSRGSSSWENGRIQLDGFNGEFFVVLDSPYITTGTGRMRLLFENGLVTSSEDDGIFDGLLPLVGQLALMDIGVGDAMGLLNIGFDFGDDNTRGFEMSGSVGSEASASASVAEPQSGALVLLALLALARRRRI